jgi:RNA polymerase sigma-70 factor (ECF subfamily)
VETVETFRVDRPGAVMSLAGGSRMSESEVVARASRGDVHAFEELYHANVGRVHALCLRMAGDSALAEELTQQAFVRAWQKLASFRGASAFSTWLHRLTVNVVLGHRRSSARREARMMTSGDETITDRRAHEESPGDVVDLERAIASLPESARTVFVLHDVEGFRHREIAQAVGIAEGTSKAQLHRARKLLRKALSS